MTSLPSATSYVEIDGDLHPADRVGPDGRPRPITEEQARQISQILLEEYESNEAFRAVVNARAERLAAPSPSSPKGVSKPNGARRRPFPRPAPCPSHEAA
jgi:hypothetical protein